MGNYTEIWAYDTGNNQYAGYAPDTGLSDLTEIHAQKGYLINIVNPATLLVHGSRATADVPLASGWNLVACPCDSNMKVEDAMEAVADKLSSVWHYEAATQTWKHFDPKLPAMLNTLKEVCTGNSYWMKMDESEILSYVENPVRIYFYHPDHLGSSSVVTDMEGEVVSMTEFYPFGRPRHEEDNGFQPGYKYTGKELDEESGLMYYGARYYDAVAGRFASLDPFYVELNGIGRDIFDKFLTVPQRTHTYCYSLNNPINNVDVYGLADIPLKDIRPFYSKMAKSIMNNRELTDMAITAISIYLCPVLSSIGPGISTIITEPLSYIPDDTWEMSVDYIVDYYNWMIDFHIETISGFKDHSIKKSNSSWSVGEINGRTSSIESLQSNDTYPKEEYYGPKKVYGGSSIERKGKALQQRTDFNSNKIKKYALTPEEKKTLGLRR